MTESLLFRFTVDNPDDYNLELIEREMKRLAQTFTAPVHTERIEHKTGKLTIKVTGGTYGD